MKIFLQRTAGLILIFASACLISCSYSGAKWNLVKSTEGKYKIEFPHNETKFDKDETSSAGNIKMHFLICDVEKNPLDDNLAYMTCYCDYSDSMYLPETPEFHERFFKSAIDGMLKTQNGTLLKESDIKIKEYPGKKVLAYLPDKNFMYRLNLFLVKHRLYMVFVISHKGKENNASAERFFNSFDLI
jgi:hypothetical protein